MNEQRNMYQLTTLLTSTVGDIRRHYAYVPVLNYITQDIQY